MTEHSPVDVKNAQLAPEVVDTLSELRSFQDTHKKSLEGVQTLVTQLEAKMADSEKHTSEDRHQIKQIADAAARAFELAQTSREAIEGIQSSIAKQPISKGDAEDMERKDAIEFFRQRFISDDTKSAEDIQSFSENKIKDDDIELYKIARRAMRKMFRMPTNVAHAEAWLEPAEQHALKTLNTGQGNQYWLENQISQEIIACFEEQTDIGALVSSENISRNRITYPLETDELDEAEWICETDCDPGIANLTIDGILQIEAHEIRRAVCATHAMIEDSLQPIESYIARRVGRQFTNARNRAFMIGDGVKKPRGMLNAGLNIMTTSNNALNPGELSWQDFALMYGNTIDPFLANSEWWMSRSAFAAALTISDANNNPIMMNILQGGLPRIMGAVVRVNTYMPEYSDPATGNVIPGATPVMFVDPQRLYRVVNRIGVSVTRDPLTRAACGVVWHFRARFGGDVLCPNAATLLEIRV